MRIALFSDTYLPEINGVSSSIYTMREELLKMGHEVHVYVPSNKDTGDDDPGIHRITSMPLVFMRERRMAFFSPVVMNRICQVPFDIVHTHSEFMMGILGQMVARRIGCPKVHTYHTIWEDYTYYITHGVGDGQARNVARKMSRAFCNRVDTVIAPTQKTCRILRGYGVRKPIRVVPTGLDIARFAPALHSPEQRAMRRAECGVPQDARVLLNIGRISKEKNLDEVLLGLPELLRQDARLYFVLIGSGPWIEPLQRQAEELGIADRVRFPGPKPWAQIDQYYAIGDAFISASRSETQGVTYIEALASGLPVVARADEALEGVLLEGQNGFAFTTTAQMQDAVRRTFSEEGQALHAHTVQSVQQYTKEHFAREIFKTYQATRYHVTGDPEERPAEWPEFDECL